MMPPVADANRLGLTARDELPETVRAAYAPVSSAVQGEAYARGLTRSHYENFSVVSMFLPRHLRQDFCNVYAFCRVADDLGDEIPDKTKATAALADFRRQLEGCYRGEAGTAVFAALSATVKRHDVPMKPFDDLIRAFEQDQTVTRYATFEQVVDYCTRSADPVGRIVLYMCGYRDEQRQRLSDKTCTALQLINFWQDVRRDILERDRIYIPRDAMQQFGVSEEQIKTGRFDEKYRGMLRELCARTERMFDEGRKLLPMLDKQYRKQIALFGKGGMAILRAIERQGYDTLSKRPRLSKMQKIGLMLGVMFGGGK